MAKSVTYVIKGQDKTKAATQSAKKNFTSVDSVVGKLQKTLLSAGVAYGVLNAAQSALSLAEEAAQLKDLERSYKSLSKTLGIDAAGMMKKMKMAANDTMTTFDLMKKFNMAAALGIPMERFMDIITAARAASILGGQDIEYMFESLTTALARQSAMRLDNAFIIMRQSEANEIYAKSIGKSASELTEEEQRLAFVNVALDKGLENMEAMGGATESNVDMFKQWKVRTEELKLAIGNDLLFAFQAVDEQLGKGRLKRFFEDLADESHPLIRMLDSVAQSVSGVSWADQVEAQEENNEQTRESIILEARRKAALEQYAATLKNLRADVKIFDASGNESRERLTRSMINFLSDWDRTLEFGLAGKDNAYKEKIITQALEALETVKTEALKEPVMPFFFDFDAMPEEIMPHLAPDSEYNIGNLSPDEEQIALLHEFSAELDRIGEITVGLTEGQRMFGQVFDTVWGNILNGPEALGRAMMQLGMMMAGEAIKRKILDRFIDENASSAAASATAKLWETYAGLPFIGPGLASGFSAQMAAQIAANSKIAGYAEGGYPSPGWAVVGERGPELANFGTGGRVVPNHQMPSMGGHTFVVNIHGDLINDDTAKDNLARDLAQRMGAMGYA